MPGALNYNLRSNITSTAVTMPTTVETPSESMGTVARPNGQRSAQEMAIPLFAGESRLLESWFSKVEAKTVARFSKPTDAEYLAIARSAVDTTKGDARFVVDEKAIVSLQSWPEFKDFFRRRFVNKGDLDPYRLVKKIANATMQPGESFNAFTSRLDQYLYALVSAMNNSTWLDKDNNLSPEAMAKMIAFGTLMHFAPEHTKPIVEQQNFGVKHEIGEVFEAINNAADKLAPRSAQLLPPSDAVNVVTSSQHPPTNSQNSWSQKRTHARSPQSNSPPHKMPKRHSPQPSTPSCWHCGKSNHLARDCWSAPRSSPPRQFSRPPHQSNHSRLPYCTYHKQVGHHTADCRARQRTSPPRNSHGQSWRGSQRPRHYQNSRNYNSQPSYNATSNYNAQSQNAGAQNVHSMSSGNPQGHPLTNSS